MERGDNVDSKVNKIKYFRDKLEKSQTEVAEELGISQQLFSLYETGKVYPKLSMMKTIADFFGATIEEIFLPLNTSISCNKEQ